MGQTLFLECASGISGDMMAAALLDLGADREVLDKALKSLPVHGFEVEVSKVKKAGLDVCDFNVKLDAVHENHDHDMEYLYGHDGGHVRGQDGSSGQDGSHVHGQDGSSGQDGSHVHGQEDSSHGHDESHFHGYGDGNGTGTEYENSGEGHSHNHGESHSYNHEEDHSHGCHSHHPHNNAHHHEHEHRGLPEILEIISQAQISGRAKETAAKIFRVLAQAEAKAHGVSMEQVHFHEVGAVDSIVDIVAVAVCLDNLGITDVIVPYVCEGRGSIRCQHGILPVPVPAVVNIAEAHRIPMRITDIEGELVTPTGAAIVAAIRTCDRLPEQFTVVKTGTGAGKRNYERPSLLRAMLVERVENGKEKADTIYKMETNVDDCTGEVLGYVMNKLLESGARDVYYTPVYMKKNRPAYQLTVICDESRIKELEQIIFRETTTIGIRRVRMERTVLQREMDCVMLRSGELKVKKCILPNGEEKCYPEYESAVELARKDGVALQQILDEWKRG